MKTFISEVIPRISSYSKKLDDISLLTNKCWIMLDPTNNEKETYIFKRDNELLISSGGKVQKGKWEIITNQKILIESESAIFLCNLGFLDKNVLALNFDDDGGYVFFIEENSFKQSVQSIDDVHHLLYRQYERKPQVQHYSFNVNRAPVKKIGMFKSTIIGLLITALMFWISYYIGTFFDE